MPEGNETSPEPRVCADCGEEESESLQLHECAHCEEVFCSDCMIEDKYCKEHGFKCSCGTVDDLDNSYYCEHCGSLVCEDCYLGDRWCNECGRQCHNCEAVIGVDDSYYCESCNNTVCEDCYAGNGYCNECGTYVECCEDTISNVDVICCERCGTAMCGDHASHCEDNDYYYCLSCHERSRERDECSCDVDAHTPCRPAQPRRILTLQNYAENPVILGYGTAPQVWDKYKLPWENTLYMGLELEMNFGCNQWQAVRDVALKHLKDKHIWVSDSSIGPGGELLVTPHTLKAHHEMINWAQCLKDFHDAGANAHDSNRCGLHIHVNEDAVTRGDRAKIMRFFQKNRTKMIGFSKRTKGSLGYGKIPKEKVTAKDVKLGFNSNNPIMYDRNTCLNLHGDFSTIEFRIFRGTLNYERFKATLEFVDAICHFVKVHGFNAIDSNKCWGHFINYIRKRYNVLYNYIRMGGCKLADDYNREDE